MTKKGKLYAMKPDSLEILFCKEVYKLLTRFKKTRKLIIPSKKDFDRLMAISEIQTMGIWFDQVSLVSILKINKEVIDLKQVSVPACSDDLIKINSILKNSSDSSCPK
jgi:hypothetical protein